MTINNFILSIWIRQRVVFFKWKIYSVHNDIFAGSHLGNSSRSRLALSEEKLGGSVGITTLYNEKKILQ